MAKILIIDDEKDVCDSFSGVLREEHHEAESALNAHDGLEKLRTHSYDLVFLDVLMPRMEGREALEKIKEICNTPVVVMSGYLPPNKEKEILRAGAFASLKKPLDLKQVFVLIEKAAELKKD